jgi:hypothetical protein
MESDAEIEEFVAEIRLPKLNQFVETKFVLY